MLANITFYRNIYSNMYYKYNKTNLISRFFNFKITLFYETKFVGTYALLHIFMKTRIYPSKRKKSFLSALFGFFILAIAILFFVILLYIRILFLGVGVLLVLPGLLHHVPDVDHGTCVVCIRMVL